MEISAYKEFPMLNSGKCGNGKCGNREFREISALFNTYRINCGNKTCGIAEFSAL
jgi:hypothetical protein